MRRARSGLAWAWLESEEPCFRLRPRREELPWPQALPAGLAALALCVSVWPSGTPHLVWELPQGLVALLGPRQCSWSKRICLGIGPLPH